MRVYQRGEPELGSSQLKFVNLSYNRNRVGFSTFLLVFFPDTSEFACNLWARDKDWTWYKCV